MSDKKVSFSNDVTIECVCACNDCRENRRGPWMILSRDRLHFKRRVERHAASIIPVLEKMIEKMKIH